jgi:hypothetical protein
MSSSKPPFRYTSLDRKPGDSRVRIFRDNECPKCGIYISTAVNDSNNCRQCINCEQKVHVDCSGKINRKRHLDLTHSFGKLNLNNDGLTCLRCGGTNFRQCSSSTNTSSSSTNTQRRKVYVKSKSVDKSKTKRGGKLRKTRKTKK